MVSIMVGYMHSIFPGFGIILQIILFAIFLAIIYWVIKSGKISSDSAEDIVKKRFARGEITKKEYEDLLKELKR